MNTSCNINLTEITVSVSVYRIITAKEYGTVVYISLSSLRFGMMETEAMKPLTVLSHTSQKYNVPNREEMLKQR